MRGGELIDFGGFAFEGAAHAFQGILIGLQGFELRDGDVALGGGGLVPWVGPVFILFPVKHDKFGIPGHGIPMHIGRVGGEVVVADAHRGDTLLPIGKHQHRGIAVVPEQVAPFGVVGPQTAGVFPPGFEGRFGGTVGQDGVHGGALPDGHGGVHEIIGVGILRDHIVEGEFILHGEGRVGRTAVHGEPREKHVLRVAGGDNGIVAREVPQGRVVEDEPGDRGAGIGYQFVAAVLHGLDGELIDALGEFLALHELLEVQAGDGEVGGFEVILEGGAADLLGDAAVEGDGWGHEFGVGFEFHAVFAGNGDLEFDLEAVLVLVLEEEGGDEFVGACTRVVGQINRIRGDDLYSADHRVGLST